MANIAGSSGPSPSQLASRHDSASVTDEKADPNLQVTGSPVSSGDVTSSATVLALYPLVLIGYSQLGP